MQYEPSNLEILLTRLAFVFCGNSVYKEYAERLPLSGSERVLDFGCGMGTVAYYVAKRLPNGHLTCVDVSQRWINVCHKTMRRYSNIRFLQGELNAPGLLMESFDVVYCHFVLHDMPEEELENIFPVLVKCLKSNGVFTFREPLKETKKLNKIKTLAEQNGLSLKDSRITDVPLMGNTLESIYIKL